MSDFVLWAIRSHNRNRHRKKCHVRTFRWGNENHCIWSNKHTRTHTIHIETSICHIQIHPFLFLKCCQMVNQTMFSCGIFWFGIAFLFSSFELTKRKCSKRKTSKMVFGMDMRHGHNSWKKGQIKNVIVMRKHFALRFHVSKLNVRYICLQQIRLDICFR